jgi:creatinine amidohydrolase
MSMTWLANVDRDTFWAHHSWSDFAAAAGAGAARSVALLPVHGFADHGLGLPLDAEEIVGCAVVRRAMTRLAGNFCCHPCVSDSRPIQTLFSASMRKQPTISSSRSLQA